MEQPQPEEDTEMEVDPPTDMYTAAGDQGYGQTRDDTKHLNFPTDRAQSSDSQKLIHQAQLVQLHQFNNIQGVSDAIVTKQPTSSNEQYPSKLRHDHLDLYTESTGDQGSTPTQNFPMTRAYSLDSPQNESPSSFSHYGQFPNGQDLYSGPTRDQDYRPTQNFPMTRTHSLDSPRNEIQPSSSSDGLFSFGQGPHTAGAKKQDSRPTLDVTKNTMGQTHKSDSQTEEDNYTAGDERTQPSAPLDVAKINIKVDWRERFPERWEAALHKTVQSWFTKNKTASVLSLKVMGDPSCAEVQITPSTAIQNLKSIDLNFKQEKKEVTAWIFLDETQPVTGPQNLSMPDKNRISSAQVNRAVASEDINNVANVAATNSGLPVPLYQFWYLHHAYRKELEQIEKHHGVSICAEVSVSINPTKSSMSDSVSKATEDFNKLVQECVGSFSEAVINHNHMDSDIVKQALHAIQSEKTKMMFTKSARNCMFFGPKKFTDMIKGQAEETRMEGQLDDKSRQNNKENNFSTLDMDTKDLPTQLEIKELHWDLMKLSYKQQLSQLETKYGVSFHEDKLQNNGTIKVQARSKGDRVNLESHATRALTHLYQKLASAAVTCELKYPSDATLVASEVEKLQQQHHPVVAADVLSRWRLVGLPEHLGPAIADIEKIFKKSVFDDKKKKWIGYSGDIPHARGIKLNQTPDYGSGEVGGSVRDEGVNLRRRSEADTGFSEESKDSSRHESKDAPAEEETCVICMDSFTDKKKLKCGHEFCRDCISGSEKSLGSICPVCKEVYGILEGNQPAGTMTVNKKRLSLSGYPGYGTIEINYSIPNGVQTEKHPNPGQRYYGTHRRAYLPDNHEGNEVLALLQRAFQQKLIFTVGRSTTTGADNMVTWNDIHHKTSEYGGPQSYGYPDPDYLKRVKDELKAKGIE